MAKPYLKKPMHNCKIFLTKGKHIGVDTWHYVKVDSLKLPLFKNAIKSGVADVSAFGEIIFSGWGKNPPDEIRKKVDELYS